MKLQTISDFALDLAKEIESKEIDNLEFKKNIENYANFLKQPLKLEMFIATRPEPTVDTYMQPKEMTRQYDEWFEKYGKEVLFEDFEIETNREGEKVILGDYTCLKVSDLENKTIEYLVKYVHIKLTESAIKRIFG